MIMSAHSSTSQAIQKGVIVPLNHRSLAPLRWVRSVKAAATAWSNF